MLLDSGVTSLINFRMQPVEDEEEDEEEEEEEEEDEDGNPIIKEPKEPKPEKIRWAAFEGGAVFIGNAGDVGSVKTSMVLNEDVPLNFVEATSEAQLSFTRAIVAGIALPAMSCLDSVKKAE